MDIRSRFTIRYAGWDADGLALRTIREQVFVIEQSVPAELEWDEFDVCSFHVIAESGGRGIGTGRLLPDGHIGRMAVLRNWRRCGVGSAMLEFLMVRARELGHPQVMLSAQTAAAPFYRRFAFHPEGEEYIDAGIPHIAMSKRF